jgi:hypothetical protein
MENIHELTKRASEVAEGLIDGSVDVATATEFNNTCGKIINAQKLVLAAAIVQQQMPDLSMPYLEQTKALPSGK